MNIVIIGASRGIGMGFVRHYLNAGHEVWASYRGQGNALTALEHPALHTFFWEVTRPPAKQALADLDLPDGIDLLINCAGIYGPGKGAQDLDQVSSEVIEEVFRVDAIGPLMAVKILRDRMAHPGGVIANVSSKMGSSTDNHSGGTYAYRAAKAALVIISKSLAVDLTPEGIRVITLHPGWVRTDMTGHSGLIDVEESVSGMANVIEHCASYPGGAFVAFDGQVVPY